MLLFNLSDKIDFFASQSRQTVLKLTNLMSHNVAFKVKTNAPKSYTVKPSNGVLMSSDTVEVTILIVGEALNTDKFLVQAVALFGHETEFTKQQWTQTPNNSLQESKLEVRCGAESDGTSALLVTVDSNDLRTEYQQLVKESLALEKKNRHLMQEMSGSSKKVLEGGSSSTMMLPKSYLVVAVLAFVVSVVYSYMFQRGQQN